MSPVARPAPDPAHQPTFWDRTRVGWHAAWYGVLVLVAVAIALVSRETVADRAVAVGALAVMAGVYAVLGRRLLVASAMQLPQLLAYVAVVGACMAVVGLQVGTGLTIPLLFVLFPQAWAMATRPWAALVVVVVPVTLAVVQVANEGWAASAVPDAVVTAFLQAASAIVLGWWITGLVDESEARADLLAQLTATRAELAAADHARGVLAERERMAGEIHDTLAQGFMSIVALSQAADAALESGRLDLVRQRVALVESTARANLAEARAIVAALAPPDLHGAPASAGRLVGALERLAARAGGEGAHGGEETTVGLDLPASAAELPPLSSEAEVVLLRAAQEGLTNARRHGGARRCVLALAVDVEGVELTVTDDGSGIGPDGTDGPRAGYGLAAMAARAAQVGGSARLEAGPERGCVLRVRVPAAAAAGVPVPGGAGAEVPVDAS